MLVLPVLSFDQLLEVVYSSDCKFDVQLVQVGDDPDSQQPNLVIRLTAYVTPKVSIDCTDFSFLQFTTLAREVAVSNFQCDDLPF